MRGKITTSLAADKWLNEQLSIYGNTCFFPSDVKRQLDELIDRFGNTYFWNK